MKRQAILPRAARRRSIQSRIARHRVVIESSDLEHGRDEVEHVLVVLERELVARHVLRLVERELALEDIPVERALRRGEGR